MKREGLDYSVVSPSEMTPELTEKLKQVALASGGGSADREEATVAAIATGAAAQAQTYYKARTMYWV